VLRDTPGARLVRRTVTISTVLLGLVAVAALFPLLLTLAALVDLLRPGGPRRFVSVRLVGFLLAFLFAETVGLAMLLGIFLSTLGRPALRARRTWPMERVYGFLLWHSARRLFSLKVHLDGAELVPPGPLVAFMRHASIVDVVLPQIFLAGPNHLRLRYVLKRELLVVPCIDLGGHFAPNVFVARHRVDTAHEVARVAALKRDLGPHDAVVLFPEGTRFTPEKRARILAGLAPDARARAERLRHVLPPHPGGVLALLSAEPATDVLFVAHHGLEGLSTVEAIWRGEAVGRTIALKVWRVAKEDVPASAEARLEWMQGWWERIDEWLEARALDSARAERRRVGAVTRHPSTHGGPRLRST
jgi:1-acyl-sn-glycerol-3-phosphate acyltransferase